MKIPLVMCTWQRIERLPITLELLSQQTHQSFSFFLWNNNPGYVKQIGELVGSRKWPFPITVHHSPENIGGFGRFLWCRKLAETDDFSHVIFFDDDQEFSPEMVSGFIKEAAPRTISSRWSFRFAANGTYWDRVRSQGGENAHYCGTCGMIMDLSLFRDEKFFSECPAPFRFVEDLWLSYYAQYVLGWRLVSSFVRVRTIQDGKDLYRGIMETKKEFLERLRELGWAV